MRIADGNKSILEEQAVVIVRAIADEHLFVFSTAHSCSNFITAGFLIKRCFYLEKRIVKDVFKAKQKTKKIK